MDNDHDIGDGEAEEQKMDGWKELYLWDRSKYERIIESLKAKNVELMNKNALLKKGKDAFVRESKRRYDDLFVKYAIEKYKNNKKEGDKNDYLQWNMDDVLVWIFNLDDGRYIKYRDCIMMNKLGMRGYNLVSLSPQRLKEFGITDNNDRLRLIECIKDLVFRKDKQVQDAFVQEGK